MPITNISKWRQSHEHEVELPSGNVALLKRVHILDLAEQGTIPAPLVGLVSSMIETRKTSLSMEEMGQYLSLINVVVKAAFVEPRVGDEATKQQLALDEIDTADRIAVFTWCHPEGAQQLQGFRSKPAKSVVAPHAEQHIRPKTKPVS